MEEFDEDTDILEYLQTKGTSLDAFKNEWNDLQKSIEVSNSSILEKEREVDFQMTELKSVREQLNHSRRNVDELVSQQEVLKDAIDLINHKRDTLVEREAKNREEIVLFQGQFGELKDSLSIGSDWTPAQVEQRIILEKERDFLLSKLESRSNQLTGLMNEIEHLYEKLQKIEKHAEVIIEKSEENEKKRFELKKVANTVYNKKTSLEKEIFDLRALMVNFESDLLNKQRMKAAEDQAMKDLDASITKSKNQMERYLANYEKLYSTLHEATTSLEKQQDLNSKHKQEIDDKILAIENANQECKKVSKEISKVQALKQLTIQKGIETDASRNVYELKFEELQKKLEHIKDIDLIQASRDIDKQDKQYSTLKQELELLRKKAIGSEKTSKQMYDLIQLNKNGCINLQLECKVINEEVEHSKSQIRAKLLEKEKFEHDAELANQHYYTALEELKLQELQVLELNKKIVTDTSKLKQKQSLYESVRSDRNLYSKQLIDSQDEVLELKRKFRSMNHHIDQMKEEISVKDNLIVKEHFLHHSVEKERELLKNELTKIRKQVQSSEVIIENQRVEIIKLQRIIEEADQESTRQKNELATVLSERNLLTSQLVKRNTELSEMYQKIKIQRNNLRVGDRNFHLYYDQMFIWRKELKDIVYNYNDTMIKLSKYEILKNQVIQLERDIWKEKSKSRALSDELEKPMNVHRWRLLESSDPKRYAKILQIHTLQKQLVDMSDKVIQTELLVQEKEKIYVELKNVIARHPGPEVEEQILIYQQTLKDKFKQLAAMNQELDMYMEQVSMFKSDISDIDNHLKKLNKKWMKTMKKTRDLKQ